MTSEEIKIEQAKIAVKMEWSIVAQAFFVTQAVFIGIGASIQHTRFAITPPVALAVSIPVGIVVAVLVKRSLRRKS